MGKGEYSFDNYAVTIKVRSSCQPLATIHAMIHLSSEKSNMFVNHKFRYYLKVTFWFKSFKSDFGLVLISNLLIEIYIERDLFKYLLDFQQI